MRSLVSHCAARCAALLLLCLFTITAHAAPGDLDTSFNGTGIVTTSISIYFDSARAVAIQPDGKIIAAGHIFDGTREAFALARYNPNGSLDTSFNGTGKVTTYFGSTTRIVDLAIQPDGKIVAVGFCFFDSYYLFALARYNPNGTLDATFNGTGKVTTSIGSGDDIAQAVAIQPDGKIVVAGYSRDNYLGSNEDFGLARYNPDGSLDTSFNGTGMVMTDISSGHDAAYAVAIQPDGKIVAAGESEGTNRDLAVARYNPDGTPDTSFNSTGKVVTSINAVNGFASDVDIQPDGKIIAAGFSGNTNTHDSALVRYNPDGSLDTSFNGTGKVITPFSSGDDDVAAVAIQPDGKIVTAGYSRGANFDLALARYNPDGSLDISFNGTGMLTTSIGNDNNAANALALQPDGKIVTAGFSTSIYTDFALARYQGFTVPNRRADFDADRQTDFSVWNPTTGHWHSLRSSDNSTRVHNWGNDSLGDRPVPGDYDGDGRTDLAVFRPAEGNWYIVKSSDGTATLRNWGNVSDIPVPGDYDLDGKTDTAIYRPAEGNWYVRNSRDNTVIFRQWGADSDLPVPADYDGDGATDIAVFRPTEGNWYIITSADRFARVVNWGTVGDRPVQADYDGDGRVDVAVFRTTTGTWYIRAWTNEVTVRGWGDATDICVPADYDGDGKADIAVFRPAEANWYLIESMTNAARLVNFGQNDSIPVPSAYLPQ